MVASATKTGPPKATQGNRRRSVNRTESPGYSVSGCFHKHSPSTALASSNPTPNLSGSLRSPQCARAGWLALESRAPPALGPLLRGSALPPATSPHLGRLGFLLPGGPLLCNWGEGEGIVVSCGRLGMGRKERSSVAAPSRPTLMLTKSLPPKPARLT